MASLLPTSDLAAMRATQALSMWDTCKIVTRAYTQDASGQPSATPTAGSAIACRFVPQSSL